jgi:hypothetical protein
MKPLSLLAFLAMLLVPSVVFALGFESFGNAPLTKQPNWAEGVADVVNLPSRVYHYWVNGGEGFYYRGGAEALNDALRKFARIAGENHQLILLPGKGTTRSFDGKAIAVDWCFDPQSIYWSNDKKRPPKLIVYVTAPKPRPLSPKPVARAIEDLDSDSFQQRESALGQLEKLGNDAKPFLRAALTAQPTLEKRRRLEVLLAKLRAIDLSDLEIPKEIVLLTAEDLAANARKYFQPAVDQINGAKDRPEQDEESRRMRLILEEIRAFKKAGGN